MRLLVDACLSPAVAAGLRDAGQDAVHVTELGLGSTPDEDVFRAARGDRRVLVTADADFGALLAATNATAPSVVLLRSSDDLTPGQQTFLLTANLPAVADDLEQGAVVVLGRRRIRVRDLPIERPE